MTGCGAAHLGDAIAGPRFNPFLKAGRRPARRITSDSQIPDLDMAFTQIL